MTTYTCTVCGASYTEAIAKTAHAPQAVTEPATCTAEGRQYTQCAVCGEVLGAVTVLPKTSHTYNAVVTKEATCTAEGVTTYTCTVCGDSYTESIAKTAHTAAAAVRENETPATCTEAGKYDAVERCAGCGVEMRRTAVGIPALGHSFTNYVYNNDATTEADGTKTAKCNRCGATDTIPAAGTRIQSTIALANYQENRTADFRATITFRAEVTNPVSGAQVHWYVDGQDRGTGETYTVPEAKGTYTVKARYIKDGQLLAESPTEKVNVKTGFFARLKAFFRALFGRLPKETQEAFGVERLPVFLP